MELLFPSANAAATAGSLRPLDDVRLRVLPEAAAEVADEEDADEDEEPPPPPLAAGGCCDVCA